MLHPSYTELMTYINRDEEVIKSRYSIVMGSAKRARQMVDNGYMEQEDHSRKPLSIAVEELDNGRIRILSAEENARLLAEHETEAAEEAAEEAAPAEETEQTEEVPAPEADPE